jgi:hypothetical protein
MIEAMDHPVVFEMVKICQAVEDRFLENPTQSLECLNNSGHVSIILGLVSLFRAYTGYCRYTGDSGLFNSR